MTEQNETIESSQSGKNSFISYPDICKKYPHAIFAGVILLVFIVGVAIGASFSGRKGHEGFEKGIREGKYGGQEKRFKDTGRYEDIRKKQTQETQNILPIEETSTGTKASVQDRFEITGTGIQQ